MTPTGTLRWSAEFDSQVLSPAVAGDGVAYVMSMAGSLTRLDLTATVPARRWTISVGSSSYGSPAVGPDGTIATSVDNEVVTVFDHGDRAAVKWRYDTGFLMEVSPAVASDGTIVIGTNGHTEIALNADGTERWQYQRDAQSYSSAAITPDGVACFEPPMVMMNAARVARPRRR